MKVEPYEDYSIRFKRDWAEIAEKVGFHPAIVREVYINHYYRIGRKSFFSLILKNDGKFLTKVKENCQSVLWTQVECDLKQKSSEELSEEENFVDLMFYRLKQLIEVGDEWRANETKTFFSSNVEYITKCKHYKIISLDDDGLTGFSASTATNLPEETNRVSQYGCNSIWRNGQEIWSWNKAYLELWLEQNPNNPQTQEMIDYFKAKEKDDCQ